MLNKNAGKVYEGTLDAKGLKFGIVCGRFNDFFCQPSAVRCY